MFNLSYFKDGMIGDNQFIVKYIGHLYLGGGGDMDEKYDYWIVDENGNRMEEVGVLKYNDKSIILADGSTYTFKEWESGCFLDNIGLYYNDFKTQSKIYFLKYPQTLLHKIVYRAVCLFHEERDEQGQPYHVIKEIAPHIANFNLPLAVQIALLHDVLEDTDTTEYELLRNFGAEVAAGVKALTKDKNLPKEHQMSYSLTKISRQSGETRDVKLADRITNLQPPPSHWTKEKMMQYHQESIEIYNRLNWKVNEYLRNRLKDKIDRYLDYM